MVWIALVELVLLGLVTIVAVRGMMHACELEKSLEELEEQLAHLKASAPLLPRDGAAARVSAAIAARRRPH